MLGAERDHAVAVVEGEDDVAGDEDHASSNCLLDRNLEKDTLHAHLIEIVARFVSLQALDKANEHAR